MFLSLPLLVLGILATDHHHDAVTADHLAMLAARLHRCTHLHDSPPSDHADVECI